MSLKVIVLILGLVSTPAMAEDFIFFLKNGPKPTPSSTFNNLRIQVSVLNDELPFTAVQDPTSGEKCFVELAYDETRGVYKVLFHYAYSLRPRVFEASQFNNWSTNGSDVKFVGSGTFNIQQNTAENFITFTLIGQSDREVAICRYGNTINL